MAHSFGNRDGRAFSGRPSRCFFAALLVFAALGGLIAPSALAAPKPGLVGTNPASPGASTMPRIRGHADGSVTSVVDSRGLSPILRTPEGEEATVTIYTDSKCAGPPDGTGTTKELEGAGILVETPVPPDSETNFFANETDSEGTSLCSNGITYQQVTTPPAPPTFTAVTPASPANENFPLISGSSAPNSIVFLYTNSSCSGAPVASGTAAAFAGAGIQVQVPDNSVTTFYAMATLAGIESGCSSSSISYQEVTPPESSPPPVSDGHGNKPPAPRLNTIPGGVANDATPLVTGSAPNAVMVKIFASPGCNGTPVARATAAQFAAGAPVQIVPNTTVTFYGRSVDVDGDESACSAIPAVYTDDSIVPRTRITAGPSAKTRKPTVIFRFADITHGRDTSFLCKMDRHRWKPCQTPLTLTRLGHKRHMLRVKAYDAAGNKEARGVKRSFRVVSH